MSEASTRDDPRRYEIRLQGHLDARWAVWFDALAFSNDSEGTTLIQVRIVDQAALHGVLRKLRDLGMALLSVTQVEPDRPDVPATDPR